MQMVYKFAAGSRLSGDANAVGAELNNIKQKYGELNPSNIVEVARKASSILHRYFDWDDKTAAEKYRLQQARLLVCSVVTIEMDGDEITPVRSFVSIDNNYESLEVVMSDAAMRAQALNDVKSAINSLKAKLSSFEEFADVLAALDKVAKVASKHFVRKSRQAGQVTAK